VENKLERVYYLKTLGWGALTRRWPQGWSVWLEDEGVEEGYKHLKVRGGGGVRGWLEAGG
jgi:hypothetical protein